MWCASEEGIKGSWVFGNQLENAHCGGCGDTHVNPSTGESEAEGEVIYLSEFEVSLGYGERNPPPQKMKIPNIFWVNTGI